MMDGLGAVAMAVAQLGLYDAVCVEKDPDVWKAACENLGHWIQRREAEVIHFLWLLLLPFQILVEESKAKKKPKKEKAKTESKAESLPVMLFALMSLTLCVQVHSESLPYILCVFNFVIYKPKLKQIESTLTVMRLAYASIRDELLTLLPTLKTPFSNHAWSFHALFDFFVPVVIFSLFSIHSLSRFRIMVWLFARVNMTMSFPCWPVLLNLEYQREVKHPHCAMLESNLSNFVSEDIEIANRALGYSTKSIRGQAECSSLDRSYRLLGCMLPVCASLLLQVRSLRGWSANKRLVHADEVAYFKSLLVPFSLNQRSLCLFLCQLSPMGIGNNISK